MFAKKIRILINFSLGISILLTAINVDANSRRIHSSVCHTSTDDYGYEFYNGSYIANYTGSTIAVYCPVPSDHILRHQNVEHINIHGYEPNGAANAARACVRDIRASSSTCGVSKNWGSNYSGAYGVDTTIWEGNAYAVPYLYLNLADDAQLFGYYLAD